MRWLGKKQGVVTALLARLQEVPKEEKAAFGAGVNALKQEVEARLDAARGGGRRPRGRGRAEAAKAVDVTLPPRVPPVGRLHPLTVVRRRIEASFRGLGYEVADGPEIETDWYNFESLNFPPDHPARDAVDTFFVEGGRDGARRAAPPDAHVAGPDADDGGAEAPHPGPLPGTRLPQGRHRPAALAGLPPDGGARRSTRGSPSPHLRGTLAAFARSVLRRARRGAPRADVLPVRRAGRRLRGELRLLRRRGAGSARTRAGSRSWGPGWSTRTSSRTAGIDPERYTGFAFGMGIDRIAMLLHGIPDLRLLFENDVRFLDRIWSG